MSAKALAQTSAMMLDETSVTTSNSGTSLVLGGSEVSVERLALVRMSAPVSERMSSAMTLATGLAVASILVSVP